MSSSNETAYCPQVGIVSDLDRLTEIETRDIGSTTNILFDSRIQRLGDACKESGGGITVSIVFELFSKLFKEKGIKPYFGDNSPAIREHLHVMSICATSTLRSEFCVWDV